MGTLEIVTAAVDDRNAIAAGETGNIGFGLGKPHSAVSSASDAVALADLKPGRYELRIAVADKETASGAQRVHVRRPDFERQAGMSGRPSSLAESRTPPATACAYAELTAAADHVRQLLGTS